MDGDFYRLMVEHSPTAVVVVDASGVVQYANGRAAAMLGRDLPGATFADVFHGSSARSSAGAWLSSVTGNRRLGTTFFAAEIKSPDGTIRFVHVHAGSLVASHQLPLAVLTLVDGTEARDRELALARRAMEDSLTGVANRLLLEDRLSQARRRTARGALAFLDVDHFKYVNDEHGHAVGDHVLRTVAQRLSRAVPTGSTVARFGGDEFGVLVLDVDLATATEIFRRVARTVSEPVTTAAGTVNVSVSIGVASLEAASTVAVLREADLAMYAAKSGGRGQVRAYDVDIARWAGDQRELAVAVQHLKAERSRLLAESRTDHLTGLPNLRALDEALSRLNAEAERRDPPRPVSVLFVDADRFGAYNHRHGDAAGDEMLRTIANILSRACRASDTTFRKGGEEFVILLPDTDADDALAVAERVRAAVEGSNLPHGGHPDTPLVTTTVGVGTALDGDARTAQRHAADAAYAAKLTGRRNEVVTAA